MSDTKESPISQALSELSDRDRILVAFTVAMVFLFVVGGSIFWAQGSLRKKAFEVNNRKEKLQTILSLEGQYKAQAKSKNKDSNLLGKNSITLSPYLEKISRELNLKLENIKPRTINVKDTDFKQEMVDVTFKSLSVDRLNDLIAELEGPKSKGLVKVLKMNVTTRHDDDKLLDARFTIATWKKA
ncbi:MAG: hypothetical protein GY822_18975 [Deltaproteobacteria bacterium]|nr:hypothetical protein [Deltaproteobacteria bacterium]